MGRSALVVIVGVLLALGLVAALAPASFYAGISDQENVLAVVRLSLVGLLIGGGFFAIIQSDGLQALKYALYWVAIGAVLVAVYAMRDEFS